LQENHYQLKAYSIRPEMLAKRDAGLSGEHNEGVRLRESIVPLQRQQFGAQVGYQHAVESAISGTHKTFGSPDFDPGNNFCVNFNDMSFRSTNCGSFCILFS
jgi:hypothetical protein